MEESRKEPLPLMGKFQCLHSRSRRVIQLKLLFIICWMKELLYIGMACGYLTQRMVCLGLHRDLSSQAQPIPTAFRLCRMEPIFIILIPVFRNKSGCMVRLLWKNDWMTLLLEKVLMTFPPFL